MIPNLPQTSRAALTPAQAKTLDAAAAIQPGARCDRSSIYGASIGTMHPPHANTGKVEAWTRRSGDLTLVLQAGWDREEPFDWVPLWPISQYRLESPSLRVLGELASHWKELKEIVSGGHIVGGAVHDARVAAICREHGVREIWSADRDCSRIMGLRVRSPLLT